MTEMSPAQALFFAALERGPADRAAFLDRACGGDAGLRARIEQMLAAQSHLGGFLDPPQAQAAPDGQRTGPPEPPAGTVSGWSWSPTMTTPPTAKEPLTTQLRAGK